MPELTDFAARMIQLRKKAGLNRREAASKAGVSGPYVTMIEKGQRKPTPRIILKFAEIYGGSAYELLFKAGYVDHLNRRDQKRLIADLDLLTNHPEIRGVAEAQEELWKTVDTYYDPDPKHDAVRSRVDADPTLKIAVKAAHQGRLMRQTKISDIVARALADRTFYHVRHFRKTNPKLPWHVKSLIAELYARFMTEWEFRQELELHFTGKISDPWHPPEYEGNRG